MDEKNVEDNSLIKKIISITTSVLLVLSIAFFAYVVIQINTNKGRVNLFGYSIYHVVSDSMEPTIPVGGLVIMKDCPIDEVEEGDIICFSSVRSAIRGQTVTHRVVLKENEFGVVRLTTRGDNPDTTSDPEPVTQSNFLGVVVSYTAAGSFWITAYRLLTSPFGFFGCIGVPVVILLAVLLRHNLKIIREEVADIRRQAALAAQNEPPMPEPDERSAPAMSEEELTALKQKITEELQRELAAQEPTSPTEENFPDNDQ